MPGGPSCASASTAAAWARPAPRGRCLVRLGTAGVVSLLAGWAVQVGTRQAYDLLLVIGNGISCAGSAACLVRLPPVPLVPAAGGPQWIALRDLPYLLVTALDGVMSTQFKLLTVALPLWLISFTAGVPTWVAATLMLTAVLIFTLTGLVARPAVRRAEHHRPAQAPDSATNRMTKNGPVGDAGQP